MSCSPLGRVGDHSEVVLPQCPGAGLVGTDLDDFLTPFAFPRVGWLL